MTKKIEVTLTEQELELLNRDRKGSSLASYLKKLALENTPSAKKPVKGAISASGKPYTGHALTDELLDDPEAVRRIDAFKHNPPKDADLIPWEKAKAELGIGKGSKRT